MLPRKTTLTLTCFAALAAALHYGPALLRSAPPPPTSPVVAKPAPVTKKTPAPVADGKTRFLADPSGALYHFFQALARAEAREPGPAVQVLHYGDSPTTADSITGDVRSLLQKRFGDAGHGFVLIAKPWAWYDHRGITIRADGWKISAASQSRARDFLHGLGGVSFIGDAGATTRFTVPAGHISMEVYFLRQPEGGDWKVEAGSATLAEIATAADAKAAGFATVPLPPGTTEVRLTVTRGNVRLFGVSFQKGGPGLIYHSLGLNGASAQMALRHFGPAHWAEQLRHVNPDLVVINYGSNETFFGSYLDKLYPEDLRQLLKRVHEALPRTSILVMSPMDRGETNAAGDIVTPPSVPRVVETQQRIALEEDCAFFNTFSAMGGAGTMARWYQAKPRLATADFLHPLPQGAAKVGALVDSALIDAYHQWKSERPQ